MPVLRKRVATAAALLLLVAGPVRVAPSERLGVVNEDEGDVGSHDRPVDRRGWPEEVTRRPLTLPRGMVELVVPLGMNVSSDRTGQPTFLAPSLQVGVTDTLTVGVRHALGLCLSGVSAGCPKLYDDLGVSALWTLAEGDVGQLAFGSALDASPLDPVTLSGEVRLVARFGGPLALILAPSLRFGLNQRDGDHVRASRVEFPLATFPFGWVELSAGNREYVSLPISLTFQLAPPLALALGGALDGPINAKAGDFGRLYRVPLGAALVATPFRFLDLGASLTFADLLGSGVTGAERWNLRGVQVLAALRL